jgi:hypothetical protein
VVDTYFIYSAGGQYAGIGVAGMANRPSPVLALVKKRMARWFYRHPATVTVFLSESIGQNLIVLT